MTTPYVTVVASLPDGPVRGTRPVPISEASQHVQSLNASLPWQHHIEPVEFCLCSLCRLIVVRAKEEGRVIDIHPKKKRKRKNGG